MKSSEDPYFSASISKVDAEKFWLKVQETYFGFVMIFTGITGLCGLAFMKVLIDNVWVFWIYLGWGILELLLISVLSQCHTLNAQYVKESQHPKK